MFIYNPVVDQLATAHIDQLRRDAGASRPTLRASLARRHHRATGSGAAQR